VTALTTVFPLLLVAALGGCSGSAPKTNSVSGKVTYKGAPVTGGTLRIYYTGVADAQQIAIGADGSYFAAEMPVGQVTVTVDTESLNTHGGSSDYSKMGKDHPGFNPPQGGGSGAMVYVKIPAKYKDPKSSGLSADIKKGKNENVNFDLTD
jgi:hypothetical protein